MYSKNKEKQRLHKVCQDREKTERIKKDNPTTTLSYPFLQMQVIKLDAVLFHVKISLESQQIPWGVSLIKWKSSEKKKSPNTDLLYVPIP